MSHADPLTIDLGPLDEGLHQFALAPRAEALELDPDCFGDVRVTAQVNYYNDRALVLIQAEAQAQLECDRTLKPFRRAVSGTHEVLFAPPSFAERHTGEESDDYDEVRVLDPSVPVLDLADIVRDTLMLALPARSIAPGAEDLELQTVYGAPDGEEIIDPRWEALRSLREDDPSE